MIGARLDDELADLRASILSSDYDGRTFHVDVAELVDLAACEALFLASRRGGRRWTLTTAVAPIALLSLQARAGPRELIRSPLIADALTDASHEALGAFVRSLDEASAGHLAAEAQAVIDAAEVDLARWTTGARLHWHRRITTRFNVRLFEVGTIVDLTINETEPVDGDTQQRRGLLSIRRPHHTPAQAHLTTRLDALVETLRTGSAPATSMTWEWTSGTVTGGSVDGDELEHAAVELADLAASAHALITGYTEPVITPGPHCSSCPAEAHCEQRQGSTSLPQACVSSR